MDTLLLFLIRNALNKTASKLVVKIITPNGIAEYSPAIPTNGEVMEPNRNGRIPNSAEALLQYALATLLLT